MCILGSLVHDGSYEIEGKVSEIDFFSDVGRFFRSDEKEFQRLLQLANKDFNFHALPIQCLHVIERERRAGGKKVKDTRTKPRRCCGKFYDSSRQRQVPQLL